MSLAQVLQSFVPPQVNDFSQLLAHLSQNRQRNMHLRDTKTIQKVRKIRFLHMVKLKNATTVEGFISGPGNLSLQYELQHSGKGVQIFIVNHSGCFKELSRITNNLGKWLLKRMSSEQVIKQKIRVNYTKGQFYLRRATPGMASGHANIIAGVNSGAFSQSFANEVGSWGFEILHP